MSRLNVNDTVKPLGTRLGQARILMEIVGEVPRKLLEVQPQNKDTQKADSAKKA